MFNRLDLFGKAVFLNFNGKRKSQTQAGAIFSIFFCVYIAWSVYHVGQDIIRRKEPRTLNFDSYDENPKQMILPSDSFNFGFGLQNPDTLKHFINESIYTVEATHNRQRRIVNPVGAVELDLVSTPLDVERCTTDHFGEIGHHFISIGLNELYCLKKDQSKMNEISIEGVSESDIFEYISVNIRQCNVTKSLCAPQKDIDAELAAGWFAVYYPNIAVDPKNYSNPDLKYRDSLYTTIGNNYFKEITMWLNHLEINSDLGWLTTNKERRDYIQMGDFRELTNFHLSSNGFMRLNVRVAKVKTNYDRSYTKVQDILAEVNGMATLGIIAGLLFVYPYSNLKFYESLINELFDVKMLKKDKDGNLKKKKKQKRNVKAKTEPNDGQTTKKKDINISFSPDNFSRDLNSITIPISDIPNFGFKSKRSSDEKISLEIEQPTVKTQTPKGISLKRPNLLRLYAKQEEIPPNPFKNIESILIGLDEDKEDLNVNSQSPTKFMLNSPIEASTQSKFPFTADSKLLSGTMLQLNTRKESLFGSQLVLKAPSPTKVKAKTLESLDFIDSRANMDSIASPKNQNNQKRAEPCFDQIDERISKDLDENNSAEQSKEEVDKKDPGLNEEDIQQISKAKPTGLVAIKQAKESESVNISYWEYVKSFVWKSKSLNEKIGILNEGKRRINERLDIFNMFKKFREVDKLKLLLLESEQLVLFDSLPKPELVYKEYKHAIIRKSQSFSSSQLREAKFISERRRNDLIMLSYNNLKDKYKNTMVDKKLLEIYDDMLEV